jgi:hypothetical protein
MKNRLHFLFMAALTLATIYRDKLQKLALILAAVLCLVGLFFLPSFPALGAEPAREIDITACAKLAGTYSKNPFALDMQQLDELRICIAEQMSATVRDAEQARTDRAIERNFGRPLRDAE